MTGESARADLPRRPIDLLMEPIRRFLAIEAASGVVLVAATVAALALANSRYGEALLAFWGAPVRAGLGPVSVEFPLLVWINDGLMAVFFFLIGLEVKRELLLGELRDPRAAVLPVVAAVGGMVAPAAVYLAWLRGAPGAQGWGIPVATDIAFVVGCLALLGRRVPHGLRVLLLSLAIADDIGAILVIAVGYTDHLNLAALAAGAGALLAVWALLRLGLTSRVVHALLAVAAWLFVHESGIHATVVGVALGLLVPARARLSADRFRTVVDQTRGALGAAGGLSREERESVSRLLEQAARWSRSPLERFEHDLHPWVAFGIMPLFALANAGVVLHGAPLGSPVTLAVMAGLVVGKPVGVVGATWLAVRTGLARLPEGVGWGAMAGGGLLCGIGFTMALFVAALALEGPLLAGAKVGILVASAACAALGMAVLARSLRGKEASP